MHGYQIEVRILGEFGAGGVYQVYWAGAGVGEVAWVCRIVY